MICGFLYQIILDTQSAFETVVLRMSTNSCCTQSTHHENGLEVQELAPLLWVVWSKNTFMHTFSSFATLRMELKNNRKGGLERTLCVMSNRFYIVTVFIYIYQCFWSIMNSCCFSIFISQCKLLPFIPT